MMKYAKVINEETKEVSVGIGTNEKFYKSIGMILMDVEQAYTGAWYVKGYAPEKPEEEIKEEKRQQLLKELDALDAKAIRPLRSIQAGTATEEDTERIEEIELQVQQIRAELREL